MVEAPKRATKFAANEQYTILYRSILGEDVNKQGLSILTGVSAGITEVKPTWKKEAEIVFFLRQIGFGIFDSSSHTNFFLPPLSAPLHRPSLSFLSSWLRSVSRISPT